MNCPECKKSNFSRTMPLIGDNIYCCTYCGYMVEQPREEYAGMLEHEEEIEKYRQAFKKKKKK